MIRRGSSSIPRSRQHDHRRLVETKVRLFGLGGTNGRCLVCRSSMSATLELSRLPRHPLLQASRVTSGTIRFRHPDMVSPQTLLRLTTTAQSLTRNTAWNQHRQIARQRREEIAHSSLYLARFSPLNHRRAPQKLMLSPSPQGSCRPPSTRNAFRQQRKMPLIRVASRCPKSVKFSAPRPRRSSHPAQGKNLSVLLRPGSERRPLPLYKSMKMPDGQALMLLVLWI